MTGRDRIVVLVLVVLAVAAGGWILLVSPERKEVKKFSEQVTSAQSQLSTAQGQLANAKAAQIAVRRGLLLRREARQSGPRDR